MTECNAEFRENGECGHTCHCAKEKGHAAVDTRIVSGYLVNKDYHKCRCGVIWI